MNKEKVLIIIVSKVIGNNNFSSLKKDVIDQLKKNYHVDIAIVTTDKYNEKLVSVLGNIKYKIYSKKYQLSKVCDVINTIDCSEYSWYIKTRPEIKFLEPIDKKKLDNCSKISINSRVRHSFGNKINVNYSVSINNNEIRKACSNNNEITNWNNNDFKLCSITRILPDDQLYIFHQNIAKKGFSPINIEEIDKNLLPNTWYKYYLPDIKQREGFHGAIWKSRNINIAPTSFNINFKGCPGGHLIINEKTKSITEEEMLKVI